MTDNSGKTEGQTPTTEETTSFTESLRDTWDEVHATLRNIYYDLSSANYHTQVTNFKKEYIFGYPDIYRHGAVGFLAVSTLFFSFKYRGGLLRPFRNAAIAYGVSAFFIYPEGINPYYSKYYKNR